MPTYKVNSQQDMILSWIKYLTAFPAHHHGELLSLFLCPGRVKELDLGYSMHDADYVTHVQRALNSKGHSGTMLSLPAVLSSNFVISSLVSGLISYRGSTWGMSYLSYVQETLSEVPL